MTRFPDWEQRLTDYIASVRMRPFEWGQHDCILFACAAAEAQTGRDAAAEYRGKYTDKAGAAKALRDIGEGTLLNTVDSQFAPKPVGRAQRGDLVMVDGAVGVCMGANALFVGEERLAEATGAIMREGIMAVPRALWERAWAV